MPSVLFVCSANQIRSPLAEAAYKKCLELDGVIKDWDISSAGIWTRPGLPPFPTMKETAKDLGLNIDSHRTRPVTLELLSRQDLILVMEVGQKEALRIEFPDQSSKIYLLAEVVDGKVYDIPDAVTPQGTLDMDVVHALYKIVFSGYKKISELALNTQKL